MRRWIYSVGFGILACGTVVIAGALTKWAVEMTHSMSDERAGATVGMIIVLLSGFCFARAAYCSFRDYKAPL